jgi:energy-coupling factor transporter transmembrane protein EcfT
MRAVAVPVKLWAVLCALICLFLVETLWVSAAFSLLAFGFLSIQGNRRLVLSYGAFYLLLSGLLYLIRFHGLRMVIFSEFHVLMFWNLTPVFLLSWDLITTPAGELSAFLSRIRMPSSLILGLLVLFRFFPTMQTETRGIVQSMKNRGLTKGVQVLRHPILTFEFVLVPLLLRCLQLADQLSVSAVARGVEAPGIRGSYYGKPAGRRDWLWSVGWTAASITLLTVGGVK